VSGSFCSRSAALDDGKPAGQRQVQVRVRAVTADPQVSAAFGSQSDFNPVSTSCGYRVSCAEMLGVDGFLAGWTVRAGTSPGRTWSEPDTSLIFSPSLNDLPEKRAKSELFAGFSHHV